MTKRNLHIKIRKAHRWLGVALGIQFLMWTVGGLYFSWSDMDEIHGDHQKAHIHPLSISTPLSNPQAILDNMRQKDSVNFVFDMRLIQILGEPIYQITWSDKHDRQKRIQLADAKTGVLRPPLSEKEATELAKTHFKDDASVSKVEYLTNTNGHHEYREQPLPAYAITFNHPSNTTVYVAPELGTVQKFRNNKWRIFDFLWMLHTMDYEGRDFIGNWLLRAFSVFGLVTILSGFSLFIVSYRK
jgi:uncharacterized iron-regulated membrane protein